MNYNENDQEKEIQEIVFRLVYDLSSPETKDSAMFELSKLREIYPISLENIIAPTLWYSFGSIALLLQEVVSIYPYLNTPELKQSHASRVCNALTSLQHVASHRDTRKVFLRAHIPLFLYPFLHTTNTEKAYQLLRITSLGVIGALVKYDDPDIIAFLLATEIIPLCLRIMETESELAQTVATFIIQKILIDDDGLSYVCATAQRFYAVNKVLATVVQNLNESGELSGRLLKHILRCYLRLADNPTALNALRLTLPERFKIRQFVNFISEDATSFSYLTQLLELVK